jgi:N utilization substance protein A
MDIDMSALRLLEREREIPLDLLIPTIEQALLVAYHKTPGAFEKARAELDRKSGHVTIWATEIDDDGAPIGEFEDTPAGFGRIAASTARQIILQRLRDVEDDNVLGEF